MKTKMKAKLKHPPNVNTWAGISSCGVFKVYLNANCHLLC